MALDERVGDMISSGDLEEMGIEWHSVDELPGAPARSSERPPLYIINTDVSSGPGQHWILMIRLDSPAKVFIYDPLGANNRLVDSEGHSITKMIMDELDADGIPANRIYQYKYAHQNAANSLCGWYASYVALLLRKYFAANPSASVRPAEISRVLSAELGTEPNADNVYKIIDAFRVRKSGNY